TCPRAALCPEDEWPASKLEHVDHAGDRTETAHKDNYREHQAQNEGGELEIGFHRGSAWQNSSECTQNSCHTPPSCDGALRSARAHRGRQQRKRTGAGQTSPVLGCKMLGGTPAVSSSARKEVLQKSNGIGMAPGAR